MPDAGLDARLAASRAAVERSEASLAAVEAALTRLLHGSYGRCERCGDELSGERLAEEPTAPLCAGCERDEAGGAAG